MLLAKSILEYNKFYCFYLSVMLTSRSDIVQNLLERYKKRLKSPSVSVIIIASISWLIEMNEETC